MIIRTKKTSEIKYSGTRGRGSGSAPADNAFKAFESIYMDGLRNKIAKLGVPITITDIQPGFDDIAMEANCVVPEICT
jgi:hypothetical protein